MDDCKGTKSFSGKGDVNAFIKKMELLIALKGYEGEKAAQAMASKLEQPAFNVYLRMTDADQKDIEKLKTELKKQYEKGNINREEAQTLLSTRLKKADESIKDYAFELKRLAALAYPKFNAENCNQITKDFFVKGLDTDMQLMIKSLEKFADSTLDMVVEETVRLELAGIKPTSKSKDTHVYSVDVNDGECSTSAVMARLDKIEARIEARLPLPDEEKTVNYVRRGASYPRRTGRTSAKDKSTTRKCRNCGNTDHLVRECPSRFCQSCGKAGHDAWDKRCPKYC